MDANGMLNAIGTYGMPVVILLALWVFIDKRLWPFVVDQWWPDQVKRAESESTILRVLSENVAALRVLAEQASVREQQQSAALARIEQSLERVHEILGIRRDATEPRKPDSRPDSPTVHQRGA